MGKSNAQRRSEIFPRQSMELRGLQVVICPICLEVFDASDNQGTPTESSRLTLEHAPQEDHRTLRGIERCLTCESCNTDCKFEKRVSNNRTLGETNSRVIITSPNPTMKLTGKSDMGLDLARLTFPHTHGAIKKSGIVLPKTGPTRKAQANGDELLYELKTAYLIAFTALGYRYALDPALNVVRRAILTEEALNVCSTVDMPPEVPIQDNLIVIGWLNDIPCAIVAITPNHRIHDDSRQHLVYLPRPSSPDNFYEAAGFESKLGGANRQTDIKIIEEGVYDFPQPRRLPRIWDAENVASTNPVGFATKRLPCDEHGHHEFVIPNPIKTNQTEQEPDPDQ